MTQDDALDIDDITLTDSDRAIIANNPTLFSDMWDGTVSSVMMKHWPIIIMAQVTKAKRGDTSAAKFLTDLVEVIGIRKTDSNIEGAIWEAQAIKLRDALELEISAEVLVRIMLTKLSSMDADDARTWLSSQAG